MKSISSSVSSSVRNSVYNSIGNPVYNSVVNYSNFYVHIYTFKSIQDSSDSVIRSVQDIIKRNINDIRT